MNSLKTAARSARSPSGGTVTARTTPTDNTFISGSFVPDSIPDGGTLAGTVTVSNEGVPTFASDSCIIGGLTTGIDLEIDVEIDGQLVDTISNCQARNTQNQYDFSQDLSAGSGSVDVQITVKGAQSGDVADTITRTVQVGDGGDSGPSPEPPDDGDGGGGFLSGLFGFLDGGDPVRDIQVTLGLAVAFLLLVAILAP